MPEIAGVASKDAGSAKDRAGACRPQKNKSNARQRPIVLMAKATEYRLDAQASGSAELVAATHGACWQNAMFGRIRYARPKTTYAGVHGCPP